MFENRHKLLVKFWRVQPVYKLSYFKVKNISPSKE